MRVWPFTDPPHPEITMVDWDDLTADQRCVLLRAVEEDYLSGVVPRRYPPADDRAGPD